MSRSLDPSSVVVDRADYLRRRHSVRQAAMALRGRRRVRVGDQLAFEFENAETLAYQVQEMVYAEGLSQESEVAHEIESYARLLPSSHELSATMFVELTDVATVRRELARLGGLVRHVAVTVGGHRVPAFEPPGPDDPEPSDRTSSVHFVRFRFDAEARDAFRDPGVPAYLVVDHPEYAEDVALTGETRLSLLADLALDGAG